MNLDHYTETLKRLRIHVGRKRNDIVGKCALQHDNARPHTSEPVLEFVTKIKIAVMKHPPYNPDLDPCAFWLSPKLKEYHRSPKFEKNKLLVMVVLGSFRTLDENAFSSCHEEPISRWGRYIEVGG